MLSRYTLYIPLEYNKYDIRSTNKSSEYIMGLKESIHWEEPYEINERMDDDIDEYYQGTEHYQADLSCELQDQERNMPQSWFALRISNLVAVSREKAYELVASAIIKSAQTLSILIGKHNVNKQGYHPRVVPAYSKLQWSCVPFEPAQVLREQRDNYEEVITDATGSHTRIIHMTVRENLCAEDNYVSCKMYGFLTRDEFTQYYHCPRSSTAEYVVEEYISALGTEQMESKFFHLFSMIEFIEKEYVSFSQAKPLLPSTEVERILAAFREYLVGASLQDTTSHGEIRQRIQVQLKNDLVKMTDIGRHGKLVNILHHMNIDKINDGGNSFEVDDKVLQKLIKLRNTYFHGKRSSEHPGVSLDLGVTQLMCICQRIVDYVLMDTTD